MADIAPLILSYPDFILGQMIDPEEFDQNNTEIVTKVNETIDVVNIHTVGISDSNTKADNAVTIATNLGNEAKTIANSAETKADNAVTTANMANTKADNAVSTANTADAKSDQAIGTANAASTLSNDTQTIVQEALISLESAINRAEQAVIDARNAIGNTEIKYDVYTIVNSDNDDGTFTYNDGEVDIIGTLTPSGYQEFELSDSYYVGSNRIEAIVNDSLNRSSASGGLLEIGNAGELSNVVQLTYPMGNGTEITFKYFTQISLGGAHAMSHNVGASDAFITMSETEPATTYSGQVFYKVVG
jgi:hypothetical protein